MTDFWRGFLFLLLACPAVIVPLIGVTWLIGSSIPARKEDFFLGMGAAGALLFLALMIGLAILSRRINP